MADFWAGYISGAAGIIVGNPLDLIKVRLQAGKEKVNPTQIIDPSTTRTGFELQRSLLRGIAPPILGYGALNALLFVSYNRSLKLLGDDPTGPGYLWKVWTAGYIGGLASWVVSAPSELIKCRAQISKSASEGSWSITKDVVRRHGIQGLYFGGFVTNMRDSIGYGFYFWSYEILKAAMSRDDESNTTATFNTLVCGGLAGVITWTSIYPLDVIKTRVQTQTAFLPPVKALLAQNESTSLLSNSSPSSTLEATTKSTLAITRETYRAEGLSVFFRGLAVCSVRAFIVNAVQWAIYEWIMTQLVLKPEDGKASVGHMG
jgi:solute carrier family 25 carnitine/acylcarnitine transporter 20/29